MWWPGAAYVTWVGIDGYFYNGSATWAGVFGPAIRQVRGFTAAPVLISETAVAPSPERPAQIAALYAGARAGRLAGVVWFDQDQDDPPYHDAWSLLGDPAAVAAYRKAAR